ncbi:hypothetical protein O1611_g7096 [Lasiodiplodia mahajangana]|uniref:Uncharacterized protein n=1 Tax=Lasiodiplodia mahajangana TaxID=1108764 RepID=A0ACC2JGA0_9PEZI|nr:hypothetical protein O1611_g7096 [Lasiodiplodia mahajangana]
MAENNSRPMGQGLAADRPRRQVATFAAGHQRQFSDVSMASGSTSGQESSFHDDDPVNWDYYDPEYVDILWSRHGNTLTIKLALWCLAIMAVQGERYIDFSYPALDSWRKDSGGREKALKGNIASVSEGVTRIEVVGEDIPTSSLVGDTSGNTSGGKGKQTADYQGDKSREEGDDGGDGNGDSDDDKTETGASKSDKYCQTSIRRHGISRRLQYRDYRGTWRDTQKRYWEEVDGGFILRSKHHTYFITDFPK